LSHPLNILVHDFRWVHLSLGLLGNTAFVVGSVFFLPALEPLQTLGVWLFIGGSFLMLVGAAGELLVRVWKYDHGDRDNSDDAD
jgi:hypothetical protein